MVGSSATLSARQETGAWFARGARQSLEPLPRAMARPHSLDWFQGRFAGLLIDYTGDYSIDKYVTLQ